MEEISSITDSLLEYMEHHLGYSPRVALERLRVADAIDELPAIGSALAQGDLSFSAAREITRVATGDTEGEWLAAASGCNLRELEKKVSGRRRGQRPNDPEDPTLRTQVLRYDVKPEITGKAPNLVFTRRPPSAYQNATLAVDTAKALRTLGFKSDEVTEAMTKTRTHVGTAALTLERWIKIALGYCPKPSG